MLMDGSRLCLFLRPARPGGFDGAVDAAGVRLGGRLHHRPALPSRRGHILVGRERRSDRIAGRSLPESADEPQRFGRQSAVPPPDAVPAQQSRHAQKWQPGHLDHLSVQSVFPYLI